jgi:hypothetical protein
LGSSTPSTSTATDGSLLRACEMPRMVMNELPTFPHLDQGHVRHQRHEVAGASIPADSIACAVNTFPRSPER